MTAADPFAACRQAIDHGDWPLALVRLSACAETDSTPEGQELLAQAAYGTGDFEGCVAAWERSHALLDASGDTPERRVPRR